MSEELRIQSGNDTIQAGGDVIQVAGDYILGSKAVNQFPLVPETH